MKILHPFSGAAGVFFPIGLPKDGGTCSFSTKKCREMCCAKWRPKNRADYEYKINKRTVNAQYRYFIEQNPLTVAGKIIKEMGELDFKILHWFASGDCLSKDLKQITTIMKIISSQDIVQCGFTRNKKLWEATWHIMRVTIALTVEDLYNRPDSGRCRNQLIAVPDYETGTVHLYKSKEYYGGCGGKYFQFKDIKEPVNCEECFKHKRGCFKSKSRG